MGPRTFWQIVTIDLTGKFNPIGLGLMFLCIWGSYSHNKGALRKMGLQSHFSASLGTITVFDSCDRCHWT